jgi:MazG family protein
MGHEANPEFARLLDMIRELRTACPWDREQTIPALARHLIEEAYEVLDAIDRGDASPIADELGDLLAQILAISVIAEEESRFSVAEMLRLAAEKLVRRHPHVYGREHANARIETRADTVDQVLEKWAEIKAEERKAAGAASALDGIARALPALMRAEKLGARARQAGMDWTDIHAVLAKVREEMDEVEGALARDDLDAAAGELGDMLLALGNAPRFIGASAEDELRRSCDKFAARFAAVERLAAARGDDLKSLDPDTLDALWQQAKRLTVPAK